MRLHMSDLWNVCTRLAGLSVAGQRLVKAFEIVKKIEVYKA